MNTFIRKRVLVFLFFVVYCNILADCSGSSKEEQKVEISRRLENILNKNTIKCFLLQKNRKKTKLLKGLLDGTINSLKFISM